MKCVIEVPKGRETDFRWYMDQLEARILDEGDHLVYQTISEDRMQSALRKYKKEHPAVATYFKDDDLLETIAYDLQDSVDTSRSTIDLDETISMSLERALADANILERFKKQPGVTPEDIQKAKTYVVDEQIHPLDSFFKRDAILRLLESTENIGKKRDFGLGIDGRLASQLRNMIDDAEKGLFLVNPQKPLDEMLGNLIFNKTRVVDMQEENLTQVPMTAEEQEKAKKLVPALRKFSEQMETILNGLRDGSPKTFKANPLIQYLDAARELKPLLPDTVALRTDISLAEAKDPQEEAAYKRIQQSMSFLDALRNRHADHLDLIDVLEQAADLDGDKLSGKLAIDALSNINIQEAMENAYMTDKDNLNYDALNKRAAFELMNRVEGRSSLQGLAEIATRFGVAPQTEKEHEVAITQYTDELIRAARAEFALRDFQNIPGVSMQKIETAQKYLFEENRLPYDAHEERHAVYQALMSLKDTPRANEALSREWFTNTFPSCLNQMKVAENQMEKDLFLADPRPASNEYAGAFLLTNDLHPFHAQVQRDKLIQDAQKAYVKLGDFCDLEDTFHHILDQAEPAPKDTTYDPALIQCALIYQDAAKNLADTLGSNSIGMRKTFFVDELPIECRMPYQEGEKTLDILRGRMEPEGKESLAEKTMRKVYSEHKDTVDYDKFNKETVARLLEKGASDKSIREIAEIAKKLNPTIKDTKKYTKYLLIQANNYRSNVAEK